MLSPMPDPKPAPRRVGQSSAQQQGTGGPGFWAATAPNQHPGLLSCAWEEAFRGTAQPSQYFWQQIFAFLFTRAIALLEIRNHSNAWVKSPRSVHQEIPGTRSPSAGYPYWGPGSSLELAAAFDCRNYWLTDKRCFQKLSALTRSEWFTLVALCSSWNRGS